MRQKLKKEIIIPENSIPILPSIDDFKPAKMVLKGDTIKKYYGSGRGELLLMDKENPFDE